MGKEIPSDTTLQMAIRLFTSLGPEKGVNQFLLRGDEGAFIIPQTWFAIFPNASQFAQGIYMINTPGIPRDMHMGTVLGLHLPPEVEARLPDNMTMQRGIKQSGIPYIPSAVLAIGKKRDTEEISAMLYVAPGTSPETGLREIKRGVTELANKLR